MRPEPFHAFHAALRGGPDHCQADLFEGSVPSIVRGLKVHANNIGYARHVALEDTHPRLVRAIGLETFHSVAERFLEQPHVRARALDTIGAGFDFVLDHAGHRDLARAEWLWLQCLNAAEAEALTLAALASLRPERLLAATLKLHPATAWQQLEDQASFLWDEPVPGSGGLLLFTRPEAEVSVRRIDPQSALVLTRLQSGPHVNALVEEDMPALVELVAAGAIILEMADD